MEALPYLAALGGVGLVVFVVGLVIDARGAPTKRAAAGADGLGWLLKNLFRVVFSTRGRYRAGQRTMAGGLLLIVVAILGAVAALGVDAVTSDNGADGTTPTTG
jgi:hypothetical protein